MQKILFSIFLNSKIIFEMNFLRHSNLYFVYGNKELFQE